MEIEHCLICDEVFNETDDPCPECGNDNMQLRVFLNTQSKIKKGDSYGII